MTFDTALLRRIGTALGQELPALRPLDGGTAGDRVFKAQLADGASVVVKATGPGRAPILDLEARMLRLLDQRSNLPVPQVLHAAPNLLVLEFIPSQGGLSPAGEAQAAEIIAALHTITGDRHGLDFDTAIGGLAQPNTPTADWRMFFATERLGAMTRAARDEGRLDRAMAARFDRLAGRLDRWIGGPGPPSLLHGDLWGGNILCRDGRLVGLIDPAVYYGDAEIELAFTTLFNTFGDAFYRRYDNIRPIAPGFFEERRALYNLYPLLVHLRLFGASYLAPIRRTLDDFGI